MSFEDLESDQLQVLGAIRLRRREINDAAVEENRALLGIINAAATRRSDKRHKFMLLAGGIVGVAVPVMLQSPLATDFNLVRIGSGLLMFTIAVGAIFDAIDERRTTPLVLHGAMGIQKSAALALAEDAKLAAAQVGVNDRRLDDQESEARAEVERADSAMTTAGERFGNTSILEAVLFFGSFVAGVLLLTLAVGRVNPGAG